MMTILGRFLLTNAMNLLIVGLIGFGLVSLNDWREQARKDRNEYVELRMHKHTAELEARELRARLNEQRAHAVRIEQLQDETRALHAAVRAESERQKEIFEKHDLQRLTNAKPRWIEKLANAATEERFRELEDVFNN